MEPKDNKLMEKVLRLTLEIIYLLTEEENIVVIKTSRDGKNPTLVPLSSFPIPERNNNKKILEVTQKMIGLLTGEVVFKGRHKNLYKDIVTMEDQPPLTSLGGSSNRNPPERCSRPLVSHDSKQNGTFGLFNVRIKEEIKEEEKEDGVLDFEYLEGPKDLYKDVMIENQSPLTSSDGSSNPPKRCPHPQYSTKEDCIISHHDQSEDIKAKVKEEEEEIDVRVNQLLVKESQMVETISKEESSLEMCMAGGHTDWNTQEEDNGSAPYFHGESPFIQYIHHRLDPDESTKISNTSASAVDFTFPNAESSPNLLNARQTSNIYDTSTRDDELLPCPFNDCRKSFLSEHDLVVHQRTHKSKKTYTCSYCEKTFKRNHQLVQHLRVHTGEKPFCCSECGKWFANKGNRDMHMRIHTGEKPFSCSECGKCFTKNPKLVQHLRVHTGEKPFCCSECGKCFADRGNRDKHLRTHTGEKPFSCPICGKCFAQKNNLIFHHKKHHT